MSESSNPVEPLFDYCQDILEGAGWKPDSMRLRSLAFTGCRPGAGVSTLLVQAAKVAVSAGQRVLLVDCNSRGKRLHRQFSVQVSPGLCEVLDDPALLGAAIRATKIEGLSLLPAGRSKRVPSSDEETISELIDVLHSEFDLVLFDMPIVDPGNPINEWYRVLDAVVMIVSSGDIHLPEAQAVQAELIKSGANVRGVVLNKDASAT